MKFSDIVAIYEKWKAEYGKDTYRHVSAILEEAKNVHYQDWLKNPTRGRDHGQSWRAFKGKNLEKLITQIICEDVEELGLKIVQGNTLEKSKSLSNELSRVQRNLSVRFQVEGKALLYLPDIDIIIYEPGSSRVVAVISSKVTLRERIAQTGYWKLKLSSDDVTRPVRVFFVTPDQDETLSRRSPMKKGRAIVEVDTDGAYVMTEEKIESSDRVKSFDMFISDLRKLLNNAR
ncbi:MAG: DNA modification methylase [Chloroflexi bacterium]|nr:DNA modification methylase [Chloroflexota bacterium]